MTNNPHTPLSRERLRASLRHVKVHIWQNSEELAVNLGTVLDKHGIDDIMALVDAQVAAAREDAESGQIFGPCKCGHSNHRYYQAEYCMHCSCDLFEAATVQKGTQDGN